MTPAMETMLWDALSPPGRPGFDTMPRETIQRMVAAGLIATPKQAWRTLEKWADKGWYEFGIALDVGWKTIDSRPTSARRSDKP